MFDRFQNLLIAFITAFPVDSFSCMVRDPDALAYIPSLDIETVIILVSRVASA